MKPAEKPKSILVAAFEPFGGRSRNRSYEAAKLLVGQHIAGHQIEIVRLPVIFAALPDAVAGLLARDPAILLLVGEARSARALKVERIAVNVAHDLRGDNAGARHIDEEIVRDGEVGRRVAFDPRPIVNAAQAAGVACEVSSYAGTFCCNALLYHALGQARDREPPVKVAFVHVPARFPFARDHHAAKGLMAIAAALVAAPAHFR